MINAIFEMIGGTVPDLGHPVSSLLGLGSATLGTVRATAKTEVVYAAVDFLEELDVFESALAKVRVILIRDSAIQNRTTWISKTYSNAVEYELFENDNTSVLSQGDDYNMLIVGGNDVPRMRIFLKNNEALLGNTPKICLMDGGSMRKRAQALMAGFDDVFDTRKTPPTEALARSYSICRRYEIARECLSAEDRQVASLKAICNLDKITPRQRACLEYLYENSGRLVGYRQLGERIGGSESFISDANLKVIICLLRKQLKAGCAIKVEHGAGYKLLIEGSLRDNCG